MRCGKSYAKVIAHDRGEKAYVLEKGAIMEYGDIKELINKKGYFSDLFARKFRSDAIE